MTNVDCLSQSDLQMSTWPSTWTRNRSRHGSTTGHRTTPQTVPERCSDCFYNMNFKWTSKIRCTCAVAVPSLTHPSCWCPCGRTRLAPTIPSTITCSVTPVVPVPPDSSAPTIGCETTRSNKHTRDVWPKTFGLQPHPASHGEIANSEPLEQTEDTFHQHGT